MIVLSATGIKKEYGTDVILEDVSFHLNAGDKVGLIGANGAGKTTLMKIIAGEYAPSEGSIFISQDLSVGYLKQNDDFSSDKTVFEEAFGIFEPLRKLEEEIHELSDEIALRSTNGEDVTRLLARHDELQFRFERDGGYTYKSEIYGILQSMAFSEDFYDKKIDTLSGGERTRLALACMLLRKPDILMLDEPTNHLDIGTLKWLEQFLKGYKGTVLIISHDRYFLDQLVNRIFEIEHHRLSIYEGNYTHFAEEKKVRRESELKRYEKQQTEIARQEEIIRRFKQHNTEHLTKRAASREKMLEHMERIERPDAAPDTIKINFKQNFKSGNDVLSGEDLSKAFDNGTSYRMLFENVNFDIKRGERICIVGANGIGKTTLLKIMMEDLNPDTGRIKLGHNVAFGYYDQGQRLLGMHNTVMDEVHDTFRLYTDGEIRNILGRFLFRGEDVFLQVGDLSGGERARLALLKLMLSGANTLILDEPTNHLDIDSKEIFEEALREFPGTVIVVSHDRYFLNRIPTRILELTPSGLVEYLGQYDYYVEKKSKVESGKKYLNELASIEKSTEPKPVSAQEERRLKKEQEAEERRRTRAIEALEKRIAEIEEELADINNDLTKPAIMANHVKLQELDTRMKALDAELTEKMEEWEKLLSE